MPRQYPLIPVSGIKHNLRLVFMSILLLTITGSRMMAFEVYDLKCVADAAMYGYSLEENNNYGTKTVLRIKDYQGIPLFQFDFDQIRGSIALSCTLFVHSKNGQFAFDTDIISTIAVPWVEGTTRSEPQIGSSCFSHRIWPDSLWRGEGSDVRSVINGEPGSLINTGNLSFPEGGGWASVEIDVELVQQLIDGETYGLALFCRGATLNRDIYSRDYGLGTAPYLEIMVEEGEKDPPAEVNDLSASLSELHGIFSLSWTAPGDDGYQGIASLYEFRYSETKITNEEDWKTATLLSGPPQPDSAGKEQSWTVSSLEPGSQVYIAMRTRDEAWNWSEVSNNVSVTVPLDNTPPAGITDLKAVPGSGVGEVVLSWTAPGDDGTQGTAREYQIRSSQDPINGDNWEQADTIPCLIVPGEPGYIQTYTVAGLDPGTTYNFALRALDEVPQAGEVSNNVSAEASGGGFNVWAAPPYYKVNPRTGNAFEYDEEAYDRDGSTTPYKGFNRVWDASLTQISLTAGRNEFVGFQLVVEKVIGESLDEVDLQVSDLVGSSTIPAEDIKLYREWYHKFDEVMYPDLLVPFSSAGGDFKVHPFSIPDKQITTFNGVVQNNQALFVDIYVDHDIIPGTYEGSLIVTAAGYEPRELSLRVEVLDFVLSDQIHYATEFNCYGNVGRGWQISNSMSTATMHDSLEKVVQRTLHEHRIYLDEMPYGQNARSQVDVRSAPMLNSGTGDQLATTDWTEYDKRYGPYFDGSAFKDCPRSGVPIPFYYLPFHTEWPVRMHSPRGDYIFTDGNYINGWTKIVGEFEIHINEMGWNRTNFMCYQNEKEHYGYVPWNLDEPTRPQDYVALNFFAGMFHNGLQHDGSAKMIYRCDIGHYSFMNGELDDAVDIWVVGLGDYPETKLRERNAAGDISWTYGSSPLIRDNMAEVYYQYFLNWSRGARGFCYWNTIGGWDDFAWSNNYEGDTTPFYPGMNANQTAKYDMVGHMACPSLRMKAMRDCNELMETLYLMGHSGQYDVAQSEQFAREHNSKDVEAYAAAELELKQLVDGLRQTDVKPEPQPEINCDFSGDGVANITDAISLLVLAREYPTNPDYDLNGDGAYTIADVTLLILKIINGECSSLTVSLTGTNNETSYIGTFELRTEDLEYLEQTIPLLKLTPEQEGMLRKEIYGAQGPAGLPKAFSLMQNYPNPFNPSTAINFSLPESIPVTLKIYNLRGSLIKILVNRTMPAGRHNSFWDGTDQRGENVSAGVYFYRMEAGNYHKSKKMILLK